MIKVLHLSYSDLRGGAAIGATRLHRALRAGGMSSDMLVIDKMSDDPSVHRLLTPETVEMQRQINRQSRELKTLYGDEGLAIRSFNLFGAEAAEWINTFPCDVVHFHWVAQNTIRLTDIPNINKPIVWKMPDMWPFSGGEHYISAFDPPRYKDGYEGESEKGVDFDQVIWRIKREVYQRANIMVTSPSRFLARCAHESQALGDFDAYVVPNPLPDEILYAPEASPQDILEYKTRYRFPLGKTLCVFSAFSTAEKRKGFHHVLEMLEKHLPSRLHSEDIAFVVLGGNRFERQKLHGYDVYFTPRIDDTRAYTQIMQCADIFLCPSEMDSTAMVVQEANALGVPSVVFDVGGMPELVRHKINGYVAKPYEPEDLAEGLKWIRDEADPISLGKQGRVLAHAMHDSFQCASRYVRLYEKAYQQHQQGKDFKTAQFHDFALPDIGAVADPKRIVLLDPSVVRDGDSSHNIATARMFSALFRAKDYEVDWVINDQAEVENPFGGTVKILPYTAYDKIRTGVDSAGREHDVRSMSAFEETPWPEEQEVYSVLQEWFRSARLSAQDALFVPMTDRILFDAILALAIAEGRANFPRVFFNFMFEKGSFLRGGYPLERMAQRLKATKQLGKRFFVCVETDAMAETLQPILGVVPLVVRPPVAFSKDTFATAIVDPGERAKVTQAYKDALPTDIPQQIELPAALQSKAEGEYWIASLGRGRRDKGYARLPAIIRAFNNQVPEAKAKFLIQRPRAMDELGKELAELEALDNVVLLDEFLDEAVLDRLLTDTDVVLLPYDKWVYGNRGSAFVWRAVADGKPLVVSRQTGLCEGLLTQNGVAALQDADFAKGLSRIVSEYDLFKMRARDASVALFHMNMDGNPLFAALKKRRFDTTERVLIVGQDLSNLPLADIEGTLCGLQVHAGLDQNIVDERNVLGHFYWQPRLGEGALGKLPDVISAGLKAGTFSEVIIADECFDLKVLSDYFTTRMSGRPVRRASEILGVEREIYGGLSGNLARTLIPAAASMTAGLPAEIADPLVVLIANRSLFDIQGAADDPDTLEQLIHVVSENEAFALDLLDVDAPKLKDILDVLNARRQRSPVRLGAASTSQFDVCLGDVVELSCGVSFEVTAADLEAKGGFLSLHGRIFDPRKDISTIEVQANRGGWAKPLTSMDSGGFFNMLVAIPPHAAGVDGKIQINLRMPSENKKGVPIGVVALNGWIARAASSLDAEAQSKDLLAAMREFRPEAMENTTVGRATFATSDRVAGVVEIVGRNPSPHPLADAQVTVDGMAQLAAVEKDGEAITLRVPIERPLRSLTQVEVSLPNGVVPAIEELRLSGRPIPSDQVIPEEDISLGGYLRLLSFGFPRARFAQWRFALMDSVFHGTAVDEIRFQLTVHDLIPFLSIAEGAWQSGGKMPLRFGDDLRLFAHRASAYEENLRAMAEEEKELLVAVVQDLPLLLAKSERAIPSRHLADRLAAELRRGVLASADLISSAAASVDAGKVTARG